MHRKKFIKLCGVEVLATALSPSPALCTFNLEHEDTGMIHTYEVT